MTDEPFLNYFALGFFVVVVNSYVIIAILGYFAKRAITHIKTGSMQRAR